MNQRVNLFGRQSVAEEELELADVGEELLVEADGTGGVVERARRALRAPGATFATSAVPALSAVVLAERAVVGAILADNALYDVVIDVARSEDFSDVVAGRVFIAISDVIEGRIDGISSADPISIASLPTLGQVVSFETLQAWAATAEVDRAVVASRARVVSNAAVERNLNAAVGQAQSILKEDRSVAERAHSIQEALTLATNVHSLPVVSLGQAAVSCLADMADRASRGETGIGMTTGFEELDALLAGLHGGQLVVLAARPGVGKTALALAVGLHAAAAGYPTLMASMEMKAKELSKRALAIVSEVDSQALRLGALSEPEWEAVVGAGEYLSRIPFNVVDLDCVNLTSLRSLSRRLHREGKLSLLIVDYLQIMETSSTKNSNREQEIAALSRGLKNLAMELEIPIIALSQLNRTVETRVTRRPQLNDLRESGAIEQDADVIMFIYRESSGDGDVTLEETAEIIVGKQRAGPTGVVVVGYAGRSTRFYSLSRARPAAEQVLAVA